MSTAHLGGSRVAAPDLCLDENRVVALLDGALSAGSRAEVEAHLDGCAVCRRLVALTVRSSSDAATPRAASRVFPGPDSAIGQYELIREIGRGGMGTVYLARDTRLGRRVAVKVLPSQEDGSIAERFLAEVRATARCKHDNIVDLYDIGEIPGHAYMVLEYLEGVTLRGWVEERRRAGEQPEGPGPAGRLKSGARVSPALAVELLVPVVRALVHAHKLGLVHRDLKPENVMLTDDGAIKVLDFGVAKLLDPGASQVGATAHEAWAPRGFETGAGLLVGTLPYMAPEQWGAGEVDGRADLWAVGIMLWELATGQHPLEPLTRRRLASIRDRSVPMPSLRAARPDLGPLAGVVDACLEKRLEARMPSASALLAELTPLLPARGAPVPGTPGEPENPYAGLAAFQEADAARFFGRDRDVAGLVTQLDRQHLVAVAGASGAGKSSFVRAGLLPALKRSGERWEAFVVRPGRDPLAALAGVILSIPRDGRAAEPPEPGAREALRDTLRDYPGYLGAALREHGRRQRARVVLFVDQFEELYALTADRAAREAFVRCLEGVADDASSPLRVVLALRSDFLDRVAEDRAFTSEITRALLLLPGMGREELRQTLVRPLEATDYRFEDDALVDAMLDALARSRGPLPLLQFAAARLWDARDRARKIITRRSHDELGGVAGALTTHADAVIAALGAGQQRLARAVLTALVSEERTRAIVSLSDLCALGGDGIAIAEVVQRLADTRLLLTETGADGDPSVELVHESLIDGWPRLGRWIEEDREEAAFRGRLRGAAREWERQARADDLLWRGPVADDAAHRLGLALGGDDQGGRALPPSGSRDRDYLEAVVDLATRARRRRRRAAIAAVTLLGACAALVSIFGLWARREAARADEEALSARHESVLARNAGRMAAAREHDADPTLVLALVRELEPSPSNLPQRWEALARWALYQGVAEVVLDHPQAVAAAAPSPDGTRIVTASASDVARVWRADGTGEPVLLRGHRDWVTWAAWSHDSKRIVTTSADHTARVWNAADGAPLAVLTGHEGRLARAAWSPDDARIATASIDRTARVWSSDGSGQPLVLAGHEGPVSSAEWSPDGRHLVTASVDRTVRVWSADGAGQPLVLAGHEGPVSSAEWSPDGQHLVTASVDKTARVWNADGSGNARVVAVHDDWLGEASWSPDGTRIATASWDKTARIWNVDGSGQVLVLTGHQGAVVAACFGPTGSTLITASVDGTARVWDAGGAGRVRQLVGHKDVVNAAVESPDGTRVVTASEDGTARVWRLDGRGAPVVLAGHAGRVTSAAWSPDSAAVVTGSADRTARVGSADGSGPWRVLAGHQDAVLSVAWSLDGARIVTASADGTARVWSADGAGPPLVLAGHGDRVNSAAWSPDGARIVTASHDRTARVWSADGAGQPLVLAGHEDKVFSAAWSPDGARIVTTSWDHTARVWSADGSGPPLVLTGHESVVVSGSPGGHGAWSPDGARIVTASDDKTLRVWSAATGAALVILRAPDLDASSVSFSPDGTELLSASHTGNVVRLWPVASPLRGPTDPRLWRATRYCPTVAQRMDLLAVSEAVAQTDLEACQRRVSSAWAGR